MPVSPVRLLIVDDFAPFRRLIASILAQEPTLKIVGEAADGLDAVQKAEELRPDLILLDVGLPKLDGIEAARRIRQLVPQAKILFVSQQTSVDAVQTALSAGADGYVVKARTGSELLIATNAVLRGEQFVGTVVADDRDSLG